MMPSGQFLNEESRRWWGRSTASYRFIPLSALSSEQAERDMLEASRRALQGRQGEQSSKDWEINTRLTEGT